MSLLMGTISRFSYHVRDTGIGWIIPKNLPSCPSHLCILDFGMSSLLCGWGRGGSPDWSRGKPRDFISIVCYSSNMGFPEHHYENAYSNIFRILPGKNENFQIKNSDSFHISTQNIDCGYWLEPPRQDSSNEYPQSMFLSINMKINVYPCKS